MAIIRHCSIVQPAGRPPSGSGGAPGGTAACSRRRSGNRLLEYLLGSTVHGVSNCVICWKLVCPIYNLNFCCPVATTHEHKSNQSATITTAITIRTLSGLDRILQSSLSPVDASSTQVVYLQASFLFLGYPTLQQQFRTLRIQHLVSQYLLSWLQLQHLVLQRKSMTSSSVIEFRTWCRFCSSPLEIFLFCIRICHRLAAIASTLMTLT